MARPGEDLTGQKFGRLTAVKNLGRATGKTIWLFRCECGNEVELWAAGVKNGKTSSCGCLRSDSSRRRQTTHGHSKSPVYAVWNSMLQRCHNPNNQDYQNYGGRGIKVCERWLRFENFLEDMGEPHNGTSIERRNVNGNYEKSNCEWATNKVQQNNRRNSRYITYGGKTQTIAQWSDEIGVNYATLLQRSLKGWPDDLIVTTPVGQRNTITSH